MTLQVLNLTHLSTTRDREMKIKVKQSAASSDGERKRRVDDKDININKQTWLSMTYINADRDLYHCDKLKLYCQSYCCSAFNSAYHLFSLIFKT